MTANNRFLGIALAAMRQFAPLGNETLDDAFGNHFGANGVRCFGYGFPCINFRVAFQ